jgi:hypothetical protein
MRTLSILVLLALFGGAVPSTGTVWKRGGAIPVKNGSYYQLPNIQRIDRDLYQSAKVLIETRSCLHMTVGEEALLKYEGPGDYAIVWEDNSTCGVRTIVALD